MTVKTIIIFSVLVIGLVSGALAGAPAPALSVLDIVPGVRTIGMGGAGVASVSGAETLYNNPAGLTSLTGIAMNSFYTMQPGLLGYGALDLTLPNWGLGVFTLSSGDIQGYNSSGSPTKTLSYGNTAVVLGFGLSPQSIPFIPRLPFAFSVGGRLKYLTVTDGTASGSGFAVDLAYRMPLPDVGFGPLVMTDSAFGISVSNLFGTVHYANHSDSLGVDVRIGGITTVVHIVTVALDAASAGVVHFGMEYKPVPMFAVRVGAYNRPGGIALTLGLGLDVQGFTLDYAYVTGTNLPGTHRVALSVNFSGVNFGGLMGVFRRILP